LVVEEAFAELVREGAVTPFALMAPIPSEMATVLPIKSSFIDAPGS